MTTERNNHSDSLSTAQQHLENAYRLEEEDKLEAALQECEAAIALNPGWAEAHNLRGMILDDLQDTEGAIEAYRQAVQLDPELEEARDNLAEAEAELDLDTAEDILARADAHADLGHWDSAIAAYRAAIASDANNADSYNSLGTVYEEMGDLEKAEEAYRQALAIDPRHSTAYYNLGVLYAEQQRKAEASRMFEKCLQCTTDRNELAETRGKLEQLLNIRKMEQPTWVMGRRRVFQRSVATAQARVLDRWKKRDYSGDSFGGWSGTILDLVLLLVSLFVPSYIYRVIIQFDARGPTFTFGQVTLEARVTKEVYEHHPPGTTMSVYYSTEDPTIATLEHEYIEREQVGERRTTKSAITFVVLAGSISGLLATVLSLCWAYASYGWYFTENTTLVCTPTAAMYSIPLGIGGGTLGYLGGRLSQGELAVKLCTLFGAAVGGILAFGIGVLVFRFFVLLGH